VKGMNVFYKLESEMDKEPILYFHKMRMETSY
jgi:hypothetical protein